MIVSRFIYNSLGKKEKHDEQVQFASFKQFCDDTTVEKQRAIKEANQQIETLKADIQKYTADAAKLTKEIAELDEDITIWQGDIKAATKVREIEKGDYDAMHKDYSESVDALQRNSFVTGDAHVIRHAARTSLPPCMTCRGSPNIPKRFGNGPR